MQGQSAVCICLLRSKPFQGWDVDGWGEQQLAGEGVGCHPCVVTCEWPVELGDAELCDGQREETICSSFSTPRDAEWCWP